MQKSCLIIGLAEIGNAVTANFSRSCSIAVPLHRLQNFSFPILNDFDSRRRQSYSRDYCSCFSTCNGVRWSECSGSFISGQDACSVKSKYLISVFASFAYVRNIIIVNVVDNGKIRCCFRENMCYLRSCCVSIEAGIFVARDNSIFYTIVQIGIIPLPPSDAEKEIVWLLHVAWTTAAILIASLSVILPIG